MKLLYQTHSPYARKTLVFAYEAGLAARLEVVHQETSPTVRNDTVFAENPLGQGARAAAARTPRRSSIPMSFAPTWIRSIKVASSFPRKASPAGRLFACKPSHRALPRPA